VGLKEEFLSLLDKDREFRYTVLGYLGLGEIIRRMDALQETQNKLMKTQTELIQTQNQILQRLEKVEETQNKLLQRLEKVEETQNKLIQTQNQILQRLEKVEETQNKLLQRLEKVEETQNKLIQTQNQILQRLEKVEETQNKLIQTQNQILRRLERVERSLEKITLDIEDEAREFLRYRLRELGYEVEVGVLQLPDAEINIYGVARDFCVVGEASVRAGVGLVDEVLRKVKLLEKKYPERLRSKRILVIYTSLATPDAAERARKKGIWVLKATGDIVPPRLS